LAIGTAVALSMFLPYVATLCPTVYVEDFAEFSRATVVLGVPHPPSYPLYTLLSALFIRAVPITDLGYRSNLFSASIRVLAVLLALAAGACGRTGLDSPVYVTGDVGTAGVAGTFGAAGAAGSVGTAGNTGTAGATPVTCVDGTTSCADAQTGETCSSGVFQTFNCAMGCFNGVCAECVPGTTACETDTTVHSCGTNGIWQPRQACAAICVDGACGTCVEGTTRCASHEGQQTCQGGRWTAATDCEFVCFGDTCGKNVRHVFATSQAFVAGELGGLSGADDICRRLAVSAGLSSSYAAWLSDDTGSPASRFAEDVGPYVLVDGTVVANNWADLTSGMLRHPIDLNETGGPPARARGHVTSFGVWTDTTASGTLSMLSPPDGSCGDWSDPMGRSVVFGSTQFMNGNWSELTGEISGPGTTPTVCEFSAPLYCFEQ
jgi:hypothetical protein